METHIFVNVEFEDEQRGCKKPMSRDLTGLVTHENSDVASHSATADVDENSDVAGYSAAAVVDERRVASFTIELPSCEAVASQKSAQVPAAPLCCACIFGRSREAPTVTVTMRVVSLDDFLPQHHYKKTARSQLF